MGNSFGKGYVIFLSVATAAAIAVSVFVWLNQKSIVYVRSHDLIEKYQGTIEARSRFQERRAGMVANVDSLELDFERAKNQYFAIAAKLSPAQRAEREKGLGVQQSQLIQYSQTIDQKIQEEDSKMMQEVLNQINTYVEEYSISKGYDVVLGTTVSGSLLYGEKSLDVTDDLIVGLNNKYKGK